MQISCWRAVELLVGFVGHGGDGVVLSGRLIILSLRETSDEVGVRRLWHSRVDEMKNGK